MTYLVLKYLHMLTVSITLALFLLRGFWMLGDSPRLAARWVRIVPHTNDTLLLLAAIGMLGAGFINPLQHPWILAKLLGLLVYIGLGTLALKHRDKRVRVSALIAALAVFAWIASVAVSKQLIPWLA